MIAARDIEDIIGAEAVGPDEDRIGTVSQIFLDETSAMPTWARVRVGLFGLSEVLVPLERADWDESALHVAVDRAAVKLAPHVEPHVELTVNDQARLYEHYGIQPHDPTATEDEVCYSVHSDDAAFDDGAYAEVLPPDDNVSGHMLTASERR